MNKRTIFHVDMDAFFASVEIVRNPSLKGKAVIVGGNPQQRGVVSTCSYEARAFGVHSAMSLTEAKRKCPHGIFLDGNHSLYREYSNNIMQIFQQITPLVEQISIDEAYLDVSNVQSQFGGAFKLGEHLKNLIYSETQLTCSIGIATNKLIAKIAASKAKPNGLFEVTEGKEVEFLAPLSIQQLSGIGEKTQASLNQDGIYIISDFHTLGLDALMQRYGSRGYHFYQASQGKDNRPVECEDQSPKSMGAETTFDVDQSDCKMLIEVLQELTQKVCLRLQNNKMRTRSVTLKIRYQDFTTITRSHTLFSDTQDANSIFKELRFLFYKTYQGQPPIRLLGISFHKLTSNCWQPTLWDWESEKNPTKNETNLC